MFNKIVYPLLGRYYNEHLSKRVNEANRGFIQASNNPANFEKFATFTDIDNPLNRMKPNVKTKVGR